MIRNTSSESGFIALMSAIIIASVLMIVVFSLSFRGFITRFNILDSEYKKVSLALAESCANTAVLRLIEDNSYAGETITINGEECSVVSTGTGPYTIHATSSVPKAGNRQAVTNIEVILNSDFSVNSWKEVPSL